MKAFKHTDMSGVIEVSGTLVSANISLTTFSDSGTVANARFPKLCSVGAQGE